MKKKVWVIMESWEKEDHGFMGYVNSVYEDYNEAVKAQEILVKYNMKCYHNAFFYANWIVERMLFYAK